MRTNTNARAVRRLAAGLAAVALPAAGLAFMAGPAEAYAPDHSGTGGQTSATEAWIQANGTSRALANALANGHWGQDSATGTIAGLASSATLGGVANVGIAFVPTSADGSAERPLVTTGTASPTTNGQLKDSVGNVFPYFVRRDKPNLLTSQWINDNGVIQVSIGSEYEGWYTNPQDVVYDTPTGDAYGADDGYITPLTPEQAGGKSILNRWPSGTHLSMVFFQTNGQDGHGQDRVAVSAGRAVTAWLELVTDDDADPNNAPNAAAPLGSAYYHVVSYGATAHTTQTTITPLTGSTTGSSATVNYTVSVSDTNATPYGAPTGTVHLYVDGTEVGTGQALASGSATFSAVPLGAGSHTITAHYDGANGSTASWAFSDGSASYSVVAPAVATNTSLGFTAWTYAGAATAGAINATVKTPDASGTPLATADGGVQFKYSTDGGTSYSNLGAVVPLDASGYAEVPIGSLQAIAAGTYKIKASFVPANPTAYNASDSSLADLVLQSTPGWNPDGTPGTTGDIQNIDATVPPGTITYSTPYTSTNVLHVPLALDTTDYSSYFGSVPFKDIKVIDLRPGHLTWHLRAQASDLVSTTDNTKKINSQNIGLDTLIDSVTTPSVVGTDPVTATDNTTNGDSANLSRPWEPADSGANDGLGEIPHLVLNSSGPDWIDYDGTLTVRAPVTTPPGTYAGTITFTLVQ